MVRSRLAASFAFTLAFVINPAYLGCGPVVEEPNFGEAEMLECLDAANEIGRWEFTADGTDYDLTLSLMQTAGADVVTEHATPSALSNVAYACGNRTFMQSASACSTSSQVTVEGELTLRRIDGTGAVEILSAVPVTGELVAYGTTLRSVSLSLIFGDGNQSLSLHAPDAHAFELNTLNATDIGTPAADIHFNP